MLLASAIEVFIEGIPFFPLRSFVLEQLEDVETLMATLVDEHGNHYVCFVDRFEGPNRLYCKDAQSELTLRRANILNPDFEPND